MSAARTFRVTSSLARKMGQPGGRAMEAAVLEADMALKGRRAEAMRTLAGTLGKLQATAARRDERAARLIYAQATTLVDVAGFFDTGHLYAAAHSLCEISDRMQATGAWHWPSVDVHLQALALILSEDCRRSETSQALLDGLQTVADRIPSP